MGDRSNLNAEELLDLGEVNWVREDIPATVIETPTHVIEEVEYEDDSDVDDTLWDFMEASNVDDTLWDLMEFID